MMGRLTDLYLLLLVIAGIWMLSAEPYALDGNGNHIVGFVVLFALAGWYATLGGGHRRVKIVVRAVSAAGASVLIAALAVSLAGGG
jgi:hypothetical protein